MSRSSWQSARRRICSKILCARSRNTTGIARHPLCCFVGHALATGLHLGEALVSLVSRLRTDSRLAFNLNRWLGSPVPGLCELQGVRPRKLTAHVYTSTRRVSCPRKPRNMNKCKPASEPCDARAPVRMAATSICQVSIVRSAHDRSPPELALATCVCDKHCSCVLVQDVCRHSCCSPSAGYSRGAAGWCHRVPTWAGLQMTSFVLQFVRLGSQAVHDHAQ
jgi:hypothetical protein